MGRNKGEEIAIREELLAVLDGYAQAQNETFTNHPLADRIRKKLPAALLALLPNHHLLMVKASVGQGNWVRAPWAAIFNRLITTSAQRGFYPVYLFSEDHAGVYLSLNQAMTEAKQSYKADAKTALRARAENFRAMLGSKIHPFSSSPINLAPSSAGNDSAFYEAGNICSVFYPRSSVPAEDALAGHLFRVLELYESLIQTGAGDQQANEDELETFYEGGDGRARTHLRVERNRKLAAKVKRLKGTRCEACDLDFSERYGELGAGFIEAHHRIPFAQLKGKSIPLDPKRDFVVLCANCHRMIHRMNDPSDIEGLRSIIGGALLTS